tara:strand:+ start:756 stop:1049 length:294 start_codon:yes stop_codon:yes gene_type:complete
LLILKSLIAATARSRLFLGEEFLASQEQDQGEYRVQTCIGRRLQAGRGAARAICPPDPAWPEARTAQHGAENPGLTRHAGQAGHQAQPFDLFEFDQR